MITQTTYDIHISVTANIEGDVKKGLFNLLDHQKAEIRAVLMKYYPSVVFGFDVETETFLDDPQVTYPIKDISYE